MTAELDAENPDFRNVLELVNDDLVRAGACVVTECVIVEDAVQPSGDSA